MNAIHIGRIRACVVIGLVLCLTASVAAPALEGAVVVGTADVRQQVDHTLSIAPPTFPSPNPVTALIIDKAQFDSYLAFTRYNRMLWMKS